MNELLDILKEAMPKVDWVNGEDLVDDGVIDSMDVVTIISEITDAYEDAKDSNIVIITSGIARKPGQTRIELAQTNVNILKDITPKIVKEAPNALYVIVSNPVDIMTYVFTKISACGDSRLRGL